jgi:predicted HTH transcriptional regulator
MCAVLTISTTPTSIPAVSDFVSQLLSKIQRLIAEDRFVDLESEGLEIKPIPATDGEWKEIHKTTNAFLNTRGGILLLGVKEEGTGPARRYVFRGYREDAEPQLKELYRQFNDLQGRPVTISPPVPRMELRDFMNGRVAVVYVEELAADQKFIFLDGKAYRRDITGDHRLRQAEIDEQEEYKEDAWQARELRPMEGCKLENLSLDPLNDYIQRLNQPVKIETIKPSLEAALPFLTRKGFLREEKVTILGALVCGEHVGDLLGFRCHVHGYVDVPQVIAQDKQDLVNNIIPLMEGAIGYLLRNIQVGVSTEHGGDNLPQYPEELLRETVNNALAHRDYSINKQVILSIRPGEMITIQNPGRFRSHLLVEHPEHDIPLLRIIPEAKPRNPKLADVLRVFRKWEGKGIGMATLVNLCLDNRIDLPSYRLMTDEVRLTLRAGRLLDEFMKGHLSSLDGYIGGKTRGIALSHDQKTILAYLIKSEWAERSHHYTVLLTPDNNHFNELTYLESCGLIFRHPCGSPLHPVYVADRELVKTGYRDELLEIFGTGFAVLDEDSRLALNTVYRYEAFSSGRAATAKLAAYAIWNARHGSRQDIKEFDKLYRSVRYRFNKLEETGMIQKTSDGKGFRLNRLFSRDSLL